MYATEYYVWSAQYILNRCRSCSGACFARVRPGIPVFELPQLLDMLGPQDMHHVEKPFLFALHTLAVQSQAQTVAPREVGEQNLDVSRHRLNYHVVARLQAHRDAGRVGSSDVREHSTGPTVGRRPAPTSKGGSNATLDLNPAQIPELGWESALKDWRRVVGRMRFDRVVARALDRTDDKLEDTESRGMSPDS